MDSDIAAVAIGIGGIAWALWILPRQLARAGSVMAADKGARFDELTQHRGFKLAVLVVALLGALIACLGLSGLVPR